MAIFSKYNAFIDQLSSGAHNLKTDTIKCALTNTAPNPGADAIFSYPPPGSGAGYTAGGNTLTNTGAATSGGIFTLHLADTVFTASGGQIGPFRYVILYDATAGNRLVGFYDYGTSITLNDTDTFTVDFDDVNGVLTVQ